MDLSIITVTWNSAELIDKQLSSVQAGCKNISYEQFIVDNGSTDATLNLVKKDFPSAHLITMTKNAGFGAANNEAAKQAQGAFLLFLNPDMHVEEGSLDTMVAWMKQHPDVGLASCKLVDEQGKLNEDAKPRRLPGLLDQLAIELKIPHFFPGILNNYLYSNFDADNEQEVDSVRGSFMLMRREVYEKLGWAFDPRYFIWFEDVDTCREVKRLGFKVMHTPIITCVDYVGQSFKKRTTLWKQKAFTNSMLTYFKKWEPWYVWIWIALARPIGIVLAWTNDQIQKH